ncbi:MULTISPECIES: histidine phosphatase family protein [Mammaliicoccus]|uniref:Histidine phosphatase family protein n=2 Tax=Mammaliicoccus lentus TaxID=42858 RepID=A0AAX3W3A4_MAMLE|nr:MULTISPECIES: histidine phosphatase family protein [Mammaliicoccus]HBV02845.1 histidine phosphatase family protein [Staphylococcus sp.]MBF0794887.1 histidine phosphatase family protein [Mammaliicoccus lentus]MBU6114233.1 histidine phosphatase family protein [Mammaliicoccus lentus]MBW0767563.1 histidine phosphatase family protein [Mammaliicoccus lentus]MBW0771282.1 histidine phosphatase family protein [Mammaliicoccus lentus]
MRKKLYIMRHGQTLFNEKHKIQGASDSPLTELGIEQATMAKEYFDKENIQFQSLYSSTQERASDTLEIICPNRPYTRLKGLKEWNFGLFEAENEMLNPPHKEGETSYGDFFVAYGGESSVDVQKRMSKTLLNVMNTDDAETILAVSHGGAMFMFIQDWLPIKSVQRIKFSNCCILEFEYEDGQFKFLDVINPTEK